MQNNDEPPAVPLSPDMEADLTFLAEISGYNRIAIVSRLLRNAAEEARKAAKPVVMERLKE